MEGNRKPFFLTNISNNKYLTPSALKNPSAHSPSSSPNNVFPNQSTSHGSQSTPINSLTNTRSSEETTNEKTSDDSSILSDNTNTSSSNKSFNENSDKSNSKETKSNKLYPIMADTRFQLESQGFTKVCNKQDIKEGSCQKYKVKEVSVLIFKIPGKNEGKVKFFAMANSCCHSGVSLEGGKIEDIEDGWTITCPGHRFKFRLTDGTCRKQPKFVQPVYKTKVVGSEVWVKL